MYRLPNKKYPVYLLVFFLAGHSMAEAQESGQGSSMTLAQAVEYALEHQPAILNAALDVEVAHKRVHEYTGIGLPQVSASFEVLRFLEIPTTFVPGEFFDEEEGTFTAVQFGQKYNSSAGVTASQLLFDGSYLVGLQASRTYEDLSRKGLKQSRIETASAVTKAYYNVLVNRERLALLQANVDRVRKLKDDTRAMYENGFVEKIDNDRIEVTYNNLVVEKDNTQKLLELGMDLLKFQMGMEPGAALELTDELKLIEFSEEVPAEGQLDYSNRIEYSILQTNRRLYELDLKQYRFQYLPSLTAFGSFTYVASRNEFNIFSPSEKWYPTSVIGARLTLPIFDGLQKQARIQQARLNLRKIDNHFKSMEQGISLEAKTARTNLVNAIASLETQRKNRLLAEEVVRVTRIKYEQGVGSNLEVVDAETSLKASETNYYQALFDALVAKTDYAKATGTLIRSNE